MRTVATLFFVILLGEFLSVANTGKGADFHANAQTANQTSCPSALPSFLEKGKTYSFTFVVSRGDYNTTSPFPLEITGKIEKLDPQTGWLYINHYIWVRKGKSYEGKYEGYSWINFNQVFQCIEKVNSP